MLVKGRGWLWLTLFVLAAGSAVAAAFHFLRSPPPTTDEAHLEGQIRHFCGYCHAFPPPDSFPRWAWRHEVEQGYHFFSTSGHSLEAPLLPAVVGYFEKRAPETLPAAQIDYARHPCPVRFEQTALPKQSRIDAPFISHVSLVHLFDDKHLDVLACDMKAGLVMALRPHEKSPAWRILGEVANPARAMVVDLDGDGFKDILVANLGSFPPTDTRTGSVVLLHGDRNGGFTPITLLENVGRVADVRAAHFCGTDKLDLVVAVFGWNNVGEILLLENHTTHWSKPKFIPRVLDKRHGAIHVPVADLNNDGKMDFVALFAQEHETIVAFINEGNGKFRKETIYEANNPGYGSSGIELVDLDGDGDLDVLYTNGDTLDQPYLLKPYHGVQWLENRGKFPFVHHPLAPMYGVHRALAADVAGNGKQDIVAVSFLPEKHFPERGEKKLDAIVLLEQTQPGVFVRHSLAVGTCDHVSCALGDVSGTGRNDLVIGHYGAPPGTPPVMLWHNPKTNPKSEIRNPK